MLGYIAIAVVASVFYYIGDHEYRQKGWLLALISVILSFIALFFIPLGFIGIFVINVLFFVGLMIFNVASNKPPGSQSGF